MPYSSSTQSTAATGSTDVPIGLTSAIERTEAELFHSPYHVLALSHGGRVVRLTRNAAPYSAASELHQEQTGLCGALEKVGRKGRHLLIDSRLAPASTDALLTAEFSQFRSAIMRDFERVASILRTKVGVLHACRLAASHADTLMLRVFDQEAQALNYLLGA